MQDSAIVILISIFIGISIFAFLIRWIFSVDTQIKQRADIISLLMMIADKHGIESENIINAVKSDTKHIQRFKDAINNHNDK